MEGSAKKRRICRNEGIAGSPSCTHTSTGDHKMVTPSGYEYQVFLSFRGPDTRSGFTDFLYTSLNDAGIRTFKDDEELRVGEEFAPELLQAINQSKISIPILSKGYASSVWCLKELVQMVECQKIGRQKIMPIFYDVAPSEVRYQTGGFGDALLLHENKKRYGEDTINEWKATLSAVGEINGWDLHCKSPRQEGEFAKQLTEEVFRELKKAYLIVSDHLVSVDKHVDTIMEMIGAHTGETRIIGIHGMGGIGKTTIAKIIYNKLSNDFQYCCFLRDIRETSKDNGIQCLQNRLISGILKTKRMNIKDIDEGTQTTKDVLSNKRVLLFLDDVEEENHIDVLVGKRDRLGNGSKIIITTRNKDILDVPEVDISYELSLMDSNQSLQLFSKHAFRRDSPLDEYMDQSKRAIGIARGLPLALEVIGSLLCRTKKEMWDSRLKKLESVPHDKVLNKLKISFDALDLRQQRIFLDIACIFIGHNKNILVHFWDESDIFPEEAMIVLENMSLIKINENNTVWMHDQLRDLGREIVRQRSDMKIEKQSRVWDPKVGLDLLRRHKGKKEVEALHLKLDHTQQYCFTYEDFESLSYLRLLKVNGSMDHFRVEERLLWHGPSSYVPLTVENSYLLPQLRWLSWHDIPPTFNVTNFSVEDMVVLDLSNSKIMEDWKGWSHMEEMKNLKSLNLSGCRNLRRLPEMLGSNLASLEYLYLKECIVLEMLPVTIGNLESLIELDISDTAIQELPDIMEKLKNLKVVKMRGDIIRKIPRALWTIETLEEINLCRKRYNREDFHVRIGNCIYMNQSLRILRLVSANIYALPPRLPDGLIELELWVLNVDKFPDYSNLTNLEELNLGFGDGYDAGQPLRWIGNLSKLKSLSLTFYCETTSQTEISLPPQLGALSLTWRDQRRLPSEFLSNLKNLLCLSISFAAITEIQDLGCLENLQWLRLLVLHQLQILSDLSCLNNLRTLIVRDCDNLVEIQGKLPESLGKLEISSCTSLQKLPVLSSSKGLREVRISACGSLVEIQGELPGSLEKLDISFCKSLHELPELSNLMGLREVSISTCGSLAEIKGKLPEPLEKLKISSCESLLKLPDLSSSKKLQRVEVEGCAKLKGEAILGSSHRSQASLWENLRYLRICGLGQLKILPVLSNSSKLTHLQVEKCGDLVEIQGELPQSLEELEISSCKSLQKLPDLSNLKGLRRLRIDR